MTIQQDEPIRIFICYARLDNKWFDPDNDHSIIPHLTSSLRREKVEIWYDQELKASEKFLPRIFEEIDHADIAILMVTQNFLNSEFIEQHELPRIRARAEKKLLAATPILVEPCDWHEEEFLSSLQILPRTVKPLVDHVHIVSDWSHIKHDLTTELKSLIRMIRQHRADL